MTCASSDVIVRATRCSLQTSGAAIVFPLELRYDPSDAGGIVADLVFKPPLKPSVTWVVARDLLWDGVNFGDIARIGVGDIAVWRVGDFLSLELDSSSGHVVFCDIPAMDVADFLAASYVAVPATAELTNVDWDALLLPGSDLY
jgi:Streptomyces sporulation and cell division protein, SsgA